MKRLLGLGLLAGLVLGTPNALATVPCPPTIVTPAPAPIAPGEPAIRVSAPESTAESLEFELFDTTGRSIEIAVAPDDGVPGGHSFLVTSTELIEAGRYVVDYKPWCSSPVQKEIELREAPEFPGRLGELSVSQGDPCPWGFEDATFGPVLAIVLHFDPAAEPYAPLMRLRLADDRGTEYAYYADVPHAGLTPTFQVFLSCGGSVPPAMLGRRTFTMSGTLMDGTELPSASTTFDVVCPECAPAAPGPPAPPEPPKPGNPKHSREGCECRAVAQAGSSSSPSWLLVLAVAAAAGLRRRSGAQGTTTSTTQPRRPHS
jgi:MYXO-CTERM domain-containing protein